MKRNNLTAKFLMSLSFIVLFAVSVFGQSKTEDWFVADKMVNCTGSAPQKCLVVRKTDSPDWMYFYSTIQGFKFRENYTQKIRVRITPRKNAPQDASAFDYRLIKTLSRSKTDGNTLEEAQRQMQNQKPLMLGGRKWMITEIEGTKVEAGKATMQFNEKEKSFGAKICNGMGGNYELSGSNIKFSKMLGTMMYCGEPLQPIEDKFKSAIEKVRRVEQNGNTLTFFAGNKAVLKMTAETDTGINKPLEGTQWLLLEIEGEKIMPKGQTPYLQFDKEKISFAGFGGCNRIFGQYEVIGNKLKFGSVGMTKMACADSQIQIIETRMIEVLRKINRYEIKNDVLNLYENNKILLKLMPLER